MTGPHRDDILFFLNRHPARAFSSRGQQRGMSISLKLAEIDFIKEQTDEWPVILLDDVLWELDLHRLNQLGKTFLKEAQVILTCTDRRHLGEELLKESAIFKVENGQVGPAT
jgi:DNA replication and repair protein RecF